MHHGTGDWKKEDWLDWRIVVKSHEKPKFPFGLPPASSQGSRGDNGRSSVKPTHPTQKTPKFITIASRRPFSLATFPPKED